MEPIKVPGDKKPMVEWKPLTMNQFIILLVLFMTLLFGVLLFGRRRCESGAKFHQYCGECGGDGWIWFWE